MSENAENVYEKLRKYNIKKQIQATESEAIQLRKDILRTLVRDKRNVIQDEMFLQLISEEEHDLIHKQSVMKSNYTNGSRMVSLTKALRMKNGLLPVDTEALNELVRIELDNGHNSRCVIDAYIWLYAMWLNGGNCMAEKNFVNYVNSNTKEFHHVGLSFFSKTEAERKNLYGYNHFLDTEIERVMNLPYDMKDSVILSCVAAYLMYLSYGDKLTSNYYLMKGNQLVEDRMRFFDFIRLLDNVMLSEQITTTNS